MSDGELVELSYADRLLGRVPPHQSATFGEKSTRHHRPFFQDYEICKAHILEAMGDLNGCRLIGRQCLVAVFVKPNITPKGVYLPLSEVKNDWWESKIVLLLKHGPSAFSGRDDYVDGMYGDYDAEMGAPVPGSGLANRPRPGDWLMANAASGIQTNVMGEGARRPQGKDTLGRLIDLYEWDGWPCRIIPDDLFIQWVDRPHEVI